MKYAAPSMRAQGSGSIINVGSVGGPPGGLQLVPELRGGQGRGDSYDAMCGNGAWGRQRPG